MGGIRRAVVVGINESQHEKLENLSGAVSDAKEMRAILKENGNFTIEDDHFLIDPKATGENIRMAISDLFWKTEECDVALFYFSGHGRRDHFGHGYLLSCDADYAAPFVKGIRIQELKELFLCAEPKKTAIMILDCCYSGIATQVEKKGPDAAEHIESFRKELSLESDGSGRFILASADADKTAREAELEHSFGGKHVHGLFSFHLIEGLMTGPKDEFGRVSLGALVKHLENAFKADAKHKPQLNVAGASGAHGIFLTTVAQELQVRLQERLLEVKKLVDDKAPMALMIAIQLLNDLQKQGLECDEVNQRFSDISQIVMELNIKAYNWWMASNNKIYLQILREAQKSNWYEFLNEVMTRFELGYIRQLETKKMNFLSRVLQIIEEGGDPRLVASEIRILDRDSREGEVQAIGPRASLSPVLRGFQ